MMFNPTSGKRGLQLRRNREEYTIDRALLKKILLREDELRKSPEVQEEYGKDDRVEALVAITERIQRQALEEHGIDPDEGLSFLQSARWTFRDDAEFKDLTVYMRYDKSSAGSVCQYMAAPDAQLYTLEGKEVKLSDYIGNKYLVIFAGSYT
jgi:hypothetical protein